MDNLLINNARLIYRNFSGAATKFKPAGTRQAAIVIDPDKVEGLLALGWNIKNTPSKIEGELPLFYLPIFAKWFENHDGTKNGPNIILNTGRSKTMMTEETVGVLDWADIRNVDIIIRPWEYNYPAIGASGVKANIQSLEVRVMEDEIMARYYDSEDSIE